MGWKKSHGTQVFSEHGEKWLTGLFLGEPTISPPLGGAWNNRISTGLFCPTQWGTAQWLLHYLPVVAVKLSNTEGFKTAQIHCASTSFSKYQKFNLTELRSWFQQICFLLMRLREESVLFVSFRSFLFIVLEASSILCSYLSSLVCGTSFYKHICNYILEPTRRIQDTPHFKFHELIPLSLINHPLPRSHWWEC